MYNAKIVTDAGKTVYFGFPYGTVFDISPLNSIDVNLATSQGFQQIGVTIESQSVAGISREISGNIFDNVTQNANEMIQNLPAFTAGRLYFNDTHFCEIVMEKTPEIVTKKGKTSFAMQLFCSTPYWYDVTQESYVLGDYTPAFKFPTYFENHIFGIKAETFVNCYNSGDTKTAFTLIFTCRAPVTNPGIINVVTMEKLTLNFSMQQGDIIRIYRENGRLLVMLERESVVSDIFYALDDTSDLMWMQSGDNILRLTASTGESELNGSVQFYAPFTGVHDAT